MITAQEVPGLNPGEVTKKERLSMKCWAFCILRDEYSAYRNGTKASEFNLFVAWYLEYGAVRKSTLHHELLKNTNFRIAYTLLEQGFKEDIENLTDLIEENKSLEWRYNYYEENYAQHCKNLLIKKDGILNKFRVKGLTKENYKNYLVE